MPRQLITLLFCSGAELGLQARYLEREAEVKLGLALLLPASLALSCCALSIWASTASDVPLALSEAEPPRCTKSLRN